MVGLLVSNGHRFIANHADEKTLLALSSMTEEQVGKRGKVWIEKNDGGKGERNVFRLLDGEGARL